MGCGSAPWGVSCEGEKVSAHSETLSWAGTGGSIETSVENAATDAQKAKHNSQQRSVPQKSYQSKTHVSTPAAVTGAWVLSLRFQESDPRKRTEVDFCECTLRWLVTTELKESKEKSRPAREARDHCCGDLLTLCVCRCPDTIFTSARGDRRVEHAQQLL